MQAPDAGPLVDVESPQIRRAWARALAQSWTSARYRADLMADPVRVLRGEGADIPLGATLTIDDTPLAALSPDGARDVPVVQAAGVATVSSAGATPVAACATGCAAPAAAPSRWGPCHMAPSAGALPPTWSGWSSSWASSAAPPPPPCSTMGAAPPPSPCASAGAAPPPMPCVCAGAAPPPPPCSSVGALPPTWSGWSSSWASSAAPPGGDPGAAGAAAARPCWDWGACVPAAPSGPEAAAQGAAPPCGACAWACDPIRHPVRAETGDQTPSSSGSAALGGGVGGSSEPGPEAAICVSCAGRCWGAPAGCGSASPSPAASSGAPPDWVLGGPSWGFPCGGSAPAPSTLPSGWRPCVAEAGQGVAASQSSAPPCSWGCTGAAPVAAPCWSQPGAAAAAGAAPCWSQGAVASAGAVPRWSWAWGAPAAPAAASAGAQVFQCVMGSAIGTAMSTAASAGARAVTFGDCFMGAAPCVAQGADATPGAGTTSIVVEDGPAGEEAGPVGGGEAAVAVAAEPAATTDDAPAPAAAEPVAEDPADDAQHEGRSGDSPAG